MALQGVIQQRTLSCKWLRMDQITVVVVWSADCIWAPALNPHQFYILLNGRYLWPAGLHQGKVSQRAVLMDDDQNCFPIKSILSSYSQSHMKLNLPCYGFMSAFLHEANTLLAHGVCVCVSERLTRPDSLCEEGTIKKDRWAMWESETKVVSQ